MSNPLFLIRHPPLGGKTAFQAFRLALGLYVEDIETRILLAGDGIWGAISALDPPRCYAPDLRLYQRELADLDITPEVVTEDVLERGLSLSDLAPGFTPISRESYLEALGAAATVIAF